LEAGSGLNSRGDKKAQLRVHRFTNKKNYKSKILLYCLCFAFVLCLSCVV
jgi:hypothetical protein